MATTKGNPNEQRDIHDMVMTMRRNAEALKTLEPYTAFGYKLFARAIEGSISFGEVTRKALVLQRRCVVMAIHVETAFNASVHDKALSAKFIRKANEWSGALMICGRMLPIVKVMRVQRDMAVKP